MNEWCIWVKGEKVFVNENVFRTYMVGKMKFIVSASFKNEGSETVKSILTRLIKADIEQA